VNEFTKALHAFYGKITQPCSPKKYAVGEKAMRTLVGWRPENKGQGQHESEAALVKALESRRDLDSPLFPKALRNRQWRRFEENHSLNSPGDADGERDVRAKGDQPCNHQHHAKRNERLVHLNELNQHGYINQQPCFSTNPVAEHSGCARHQVESRRGA
jgi:hypothetical protein